MSNSHLISPLPQHFKVSSCTHVPISNLFISIVKKKRVLNRLHTEVQSHLIIIIIIVICIGNIPILISDAILRPNFSVPIPLVIHLITLIMYS